MTLSGVPKLIANDSRRSLRQAIAERYRFVCESKVDGVRGLVANGSEHTIETRNRRRRASGLAARGDQSDAGP